MYCKIMLVLFRFFLCIRDEDTKAPDSFIKRRFTSPKSGIISSFLEDCLSVDSDPKVAVSSWALLGHINLFVLFCFSGKR